LDIKKGYNEMGTYKKQEMQIVETRTYNKDV
jgi:hypothetical protein